MIRMYEYEPRTDAAGNKTEAYRDFQNYLFSHPYGFLWDFPADKVTIYGVAYRISSLRRIPDGSAAQVTIGGGDPTPVQVTCVLDPTPIQVTCMLDPTPVQVTCNCDPAPVQVTCALDPTPIQVTCNCDPAPVQVTCQCNCNCGAGDPPPVSESPSATLNSSLPTGEYPAKTEPMEMTFTVTVTAGTLPVKHVALFLNEYQIHEFEAVPSSHVYTLNFNEANLEGVAPPDTDKVMNFRAVVSDGRTFFITNTLTYTFAEDPNAEGYVFMVDGQTEILDLVVEGNTVRLPVVSTNGGAFTPYELNDWDGALASFDLGENTLTLQFNELTWGVTKQGYLDLYQPESEKWVQINYRQTMGVWEIEIWFRSNLTKREFAADQQNTHPIRFRGEALKGPGTLEVNYNGTWIGIGGSGEGHAGEEVAGTSEDWGETVNFTLEKTFFPTNAPIDLGVRMTCPVSLQVGWDNQAPPYPATYNSHIFEIVSARGKIDRLNIGNADLTEFPLHELEIYRFLEMQANHLTIEAINRTIGQLPVAPPSEYGMAAIRCGYNPITIECDQYGYRFTDDVVCSVENLFALPPSGWVVENVM